jgi:hypothetical protein
MGQSCLTRFAADADVPVVEVDGRVAMAGREADLVADLRPVGGTRDDEAAVLVGGALVGGGGFVELGELGAVVGVSTESRRARDRSGTGKVSGVVQDVPPYCTRLRRRTRKNRAPNPEASTLIVPGSGTDGGDDPTLPSSVSVTLPMIWS